MPTLDFLVHGEDPFPPCQAAGCLVLSQLQSELIGDCLYGMNTENSGVVCLACATQPWRRLQRLVDRIDRHRSVCRAGVSARQYLMSTSGGAYVISRRSKVRRYIYISFRRRISQQRTLKLQGSEAVFGGDLKLSILDKILNE